MGIAGVAIGTLVAQWAGFVMSLLSLRSSYAKEWHTTLSNAITKLQSHTEIFTISFFSANRDIFLRTLCLVSVNLFFTAAGSRQGAMMLSVNTLLMTFFTLFSYVMDGFAYAGEALAGRYFGARDTASLNRLVLRLMHWGMALSVAFSLIYLLAGEAILGLLTDKQPVVVAAADYRLWAVAVPLTGFVRRHLHRHNGNTGNVHVVPCGGNSLLSYLLLTVRRMAQPCPLARTKHLSCPPRSSPCCCFHARQQAKNTEKSSGLWTE